MNAVSPISQYEKEQVFAALCAIYDDSPWTTLSSLDEHLLTMLRATIGPQEWAQQIFIGFVDNPTFNAFAATYNGVDYIGINRACYPLLINVFRGILADRKILEGIGDPNIPQMPYKIECDPECLTNVNNAPAFPLLDDPVRNELVEGLAEISLLYTLFHEKTHIQNGHVNWWNSHGGFRRMSEIRYGSATPASNLQSQTLEFDADMGAGQDILQLVLRAAADNSKFPSTWLIPELNYFGNATTGVSVAALASHVVHLMFARFLSSEEHPFQFEHPPSSVRLEMTAAQIVHVLSYRADWDEHETAKLVIEPTMAASAALYTAIGTESPNDRGGDQFTSIVCSYSNAFLRCWRSLRPELLPFVRGDYILPPAQDETALAGDDLFRDYVD